MLESYLDLARKVGATDESGGRAEGVVCFTKDEIERFVNELRKECIQEVCRAGVGKLAGEAYCVDRIVAHLENHFSIKLS